ncbi:MAG: ATP-binding protein [Candidatus Velthaea sp.]
MAVYRALFRGSSSVRAARGAVVDFARTCGLSGLGLSDVESAVGEALANAAEHGGGASCEFEVTARCDRDTLVVEVADKGPGFEHWNATDFLRPLDSAPRGFGIFIMRAVMDRVEYSEGGRHLRLVKQIRTPNPREAARREA